MDSKTPIVAVGHLPVHFDSLTESIRPHFALSVVKWRPTHRSAVGSFITIPRIMFRVLFTMVRSAAKVVLAQYAFPDGFTSVLASSLLRRYCFIQVVGSDIRQLSRGPRLALTSWCLRNAAGVICVSKDLEQRSRKLGAKQTHVIPTPLDVSVFSRRRQPDRQQRLVTVANLIPLKGIDILIRALHNGPTVKLIVIGDGPERERLEKLSRELKLENYVTFTGFISQEKLAEHLQSSNIFVLPSLSEGVPRSILEAMACGMFVIATRVGGVPDVVTDGKNGLLVQPNDAKALSEAIRWALADPQRLAAVGETNRIAAQRYDVEVIGREVSDFIRSFFK